MRLLNALLMCACAGCAANRSTPVAPSQVSTADESATLAICITSLGKVTRVNLIESSGDPEIDKRLLTTLHNRQLSPRPSGMPECVTVRIGLDLSGAPSPAVESRQ